MDDLSKKLGYLCGLLAAKENDEVTSALTDLLTALTDAVNMHETLLDDLNDYVESIDDDLSALEEGRGEDFDEDDDYEPSPFRILNGRSDPAEDDEEDEDAEDDDDPIPTAAGCVCPECAALFLISANDRPGLKYICPQCGKIVYPGPLTAESLKPVPPIN